MISSFFKSRKPKRFDFKARYYDENKEEMEERYARIKSELEGSENIGAYRRTDFRSQWTKRKKTSTFERKSNLRLVLIFAILCALSYILLYT
jgi:hypothetical protein